MRLLVFFDLPVETSKQRKNYRLFRKFLIKEGYLMQQLSVYSKLEVNENSLNADLVRLRSNRPPEGVVQVLRVTEKQFAGMEYIVGSKGIVEKIDDSESLVVI